MDAIGRLRRAPLWAVWAGGAVPLLWLVADVMSGAAGVDPVRAIEHRLGRVAVYLLLATLCMTPLLRIARMNLMRFRRPLGQLSAAYAGLHLVAWAVFDMGLRWGQMMGDILKRPYLTIGMVSALILAALAATSGSGAIRRMGAARWRALHRWIYAAVPLAILHWLLAYKIWPARPLLLAGGFAILMLMRLGSLPRVIRPSQKN